MILLPALVSALPIADAALAVVRDEPEVEDSAKRPRRLQDSGRFVDLQVGSEFGIFVHYGLLSFPGMGRSTKGSVISTKIESRST